MSTRGLRYAVYRAYDADDRLLYVGQGEIPGQRIYDHKRLAPFRDRIARTEVEWFTNRPDALIHERALTLSLNPEFPTHVTGHQARRLAAAYVSRDLRKGPVWYGDPECPNPRQRAREILTESGYYDDSCVTPRERPSTDEEYAAECAAIRAEVMDRMPKYGT
jgi:hypothetical protein